MTTFFGKWEPKFPAIPEDKKLETEPFLAAAKGIPPFFEIFGTAFKPVRSDMDGNITKLEKAQKKNPDKSKTLYEMLEDDIATNNTKNKESATVALIWLTRGLEYCMTVLKALIEDKKSGTPTENIREFCQKAYEENLKMYHGWIIQKVFSVVSHAAPYRKDLIKGVALGDESQEEQAYTDMEEFVGMLGAQIEAIKWMFKELNVDDTIKA